MFVAARLTVTGLDVVAGRTTSALVNDPNGAAGAATPPTAVILRLGALDSVTEVGAPDDRTPTLRVPRLTASVLVNASARTRPGLPAPPSTDADNAPPLPPETLAVPVVPVIVVAIRRTEPPLPPPPGAVPP